jgi:hypothetical protein
MSRTRRALRREAPELIDLQDDLLGRLPSNGSAPTPTGPVATEFEAHGDPEGDLTRGAVRPADDGRE